MKYRLLLTLSLCLLLTACGSLQTQDGAPKRYVDVTNIPNAVPKSEPRSRFGNPRSYVVNGRRYYVLRSARGYDKKGIASWYGTKFHGHLTSTREIYDMFGMTAASTELPLPTYVQVTNLGNGRQVIVKANDRGPFDKDRILDLSYAAARKLGYVHKGTALVEVKAINPIRWQRQQQQLQQPPSQTLPPVISSTSSPQIFLQIGAFANENNANNLRNHIAELTNRNVIVKIGRFNNRPIYRVQIGPLRNVNENDQLQKLLVNQGLGRAMTIID